MHRNKKIILLSHCLLNVNSKIINLANYKGSLQELIIPLIKKDYAFLQLPCPEIQSHGLKRWGQVKEQYNTPYFRKHCKKLLLPIIEQLIDYKNNNYSIKACIGVDGSPSCGVFQTCKSCKYEGEIQNSSSFLNDKLNSISFVEEKGVFMEVFQELLDKYNLHMNFYAINEMNPQISIENILKEL